MNEKKASTSKNTKGDRATFEAEQGEALDLAVEWVLGQAEGKKTVSGWQLFKTFGVTGVEINGAQFSHVSPDAVLRLLEMAKHNPYAFDLASYIAGTYLIVLSNLGIEISKPLMHFSARVLTGEIKRPVCRGRPKEDSYLKIWQYILCQRASKFGNLHPTRADSKHSNGFSACDAVAEAFTRAGKSTTYGQMKSLCYDGHLQDIRETADYLFSSDLFDST